MQTAGSAGDLTRTEKNPAGAAGAFVPPALDTPPGRWHSRGYLPHYDRAGQIQMVTYRLGDALPKAVAERLARGLDARAPEGEYRRRIESYLDSGFGACLLSRAEVASCVRETWLKFDRDRSLLHGRVIMPNHVHVVVETRTEYSLGAVVKGWKSVTARGIHRICGSRGRVWQEEYWDRFIRDRSHYRSAMQYMAENPVKAKLVYRPEDWSWSSFSKKQE